MDLEESLRPELSQLLDRATPVTADDALRLARPRIASRGQRRRWVLRTATVAFVVGAALVAVLAQSGTSVAPAVVAEGAAFGPCTGQPPGCGSPQSTASALATGSWSSFPQGPLSPRTGQVEVWNGTELIIWGGESSTSSTPTPLGDGASYDPINRSWRMLPVSPLPPGDDVSAAWTGTEMLVVSGTATAAYRPGKQHLGDASVVSSRITDRCLSHVDRSTTDRGRRQRGRCSRQPQYDDGAAYNPVTNTWGTLPPFRPSAAPCWTQRWLGRAVTSTSG
ncbi:MAG: hypothetical protein ACYDC0_12595 [Acidimicrobiales bacterium]